MLGEWPVYPRQDFQSMFVNLNLHPKESQWREQERKAFQTTLELCISLLTLTDWRKILLALGRADFTLNIFNVFIQIGLKDEKIVWKDTEAHQEQFLSEKS